MARQTGDIKIRGTIDAICFYEMEGAHFARLKSSLTRKRFWKDPAFENSRRSCGRFGKANQLASKVYRSIQKEERNYRLFCILKKAAIELAKLGLSDGEVVAALEQYL